MTEEKKQRIRDRWDKITENEKFKYEPFPEDNSIMIGSNVCISVYKGIEIIAEAYDLEVEKVADDLGNVYKQLIINDVRIYQWVKLGKWRFDDAIGDWRVDDEI